MKKLYFILFIVLLCTTCNRQVNKDTINIASQLSKTIIGKVSDFADSVSYIILETTDKCLLPEYSLVEYIDEQNIFVRGGHILYRFDRNGAFKNRIGRIGQGPGEHTYLYDAKVDYDNNLILMLIPGGKVYVYDFDGDFVRQINLSDYTDHQMWYMGNNTFAVIASSDENGFTTFLRLYDYDGELLQQHMLMTDKYDFERVLRTVPMLYETVDCLNIKFFYNDTIYRFLDESILASKVLNTGKFLPCRELIENIHRRKDLDNNYLLIETIVDSERYMFIRSNWKNRRFGFVYDKMNETFLHSGSLSTRFESEFGIENDMTGYGKFWPKMTTVRGENIVVQLIYPHDAGFTDMEEDDNPVVQVVHLK
jgi:hypothetical protein